MNIRKRLQFWTARFNRWLSQPSSPVDNPMPIKYVIVNSDPFMVRLLKGLGLDPAICGDSTIEAPIDGIYTIKVNLFVTQEAWDAAINGEPNPK